MKVQSLLLAIAMYSASAMCQSSERNALIEQIEAFYVQGQLFSTDSPAVDMFLTAAKSANPGASPQVWAVVKKGIATAIQKLLTEKNGLLDVAVRNSVQSMSDADLLTLSQIFRDPTFNRFQREMSSPSTQQKIFQGLLSNALKLNGAINEVLAKNGLREVH